MKHLYCVTFVLLALVACERGPTETGRSPGIALVSGAGQSDTVMSTLGAPLVFQVTGANGKPASGVQLKLSAEFSTVYRPYWQRERPLPHLILATQDFSVVGPTLTLLTERDGTARVVVTLGQLAGPTTLHVEVPELGFTTATSFNPLPGRAVGVLVLPRDTSIYPGASYSLRAAGVDRWHNLRPSDPITLAMGSGASASVQDRQLRGREIGRATVVAHHEDGFRDSAWVSVVPTGQIVAVQRAGYPGDTARIVYFNLDGSDYRQVDTERGDNSAAWLLSGDGIVLENSGTDRNEFRSHVGVADAAGRRPLVPVSTGFVQTMQAHVGQDGWIYFAADPQTGQSYMEIWRIRPDGTGEERLGEAAGYYEGDSAPSISADGEKLAYVTTRDSCCNSETVRVRTLASGTDLVIGGGIRGYAPSFSPTDASLLVFGVPSPGTMNHFALDIYAVRADGTQMRRVSEEGRPYRAPFRWSPDGKWLIANRFDSDVIELIEVSTGQALPLGFAAWLSGASWK